MPDIQLFLKKIKVEKKIFDKKVIGLVFGLLSFVLMSIAIIHFEVLYLSVIIFFL